MGGVNGRDRLVLLPLLPRGGSRLRKKPILMTDDVAILAVALLARVVYLVTIRDDPLFGFPQVDARVFWDHAVQLARGGGGEAVFYRPPLLSWILAIAIRLFGESPGAARTALGLFSALAAPLAAQIARPVTGRWGALAAGLFTALFAPAVFYGAELLPASTALVLDLAALRALIAAEEGRKPFPYGVAGSLLGFSALGRPTILLFVPLLLIRLRRAPRFAFALLAGTLVAIAPATIHNAAGGDRVLISSNGGLNFYLGNHEGADGRSARAIDLPDEPGEARRAASAIASREAGRALTPSAISRYWFRRAFRWIATDPAGWAALTARRLFYLCNSHEISDNIDFYAIAERSAPLRYLPFRFAILFVLAALGTRRLVTGRAGRLVALYALAAAAPPLLFFVVGRFRLALLPFLAVSAAAGVVEIASLRRAPRRRLLAPIAVALAAGALTGWNSFGVRADATWHYHYLVGDALYRQGKVKESAAAFEEAFRRNSNSAATRNALGFLYAESGGDLDRAEELVRGALALDPARRRFYLDSLGRVLFCRGDLAAAAAAFEEAIPLFREEESFSKREALGHLADVRAAQGREEEAAALRSRAEAIALGGRFP